jgi:alpha-mannosidase
VRPSVVVVSHTHWDREWHQTFEVFRLRLCEMVASLLDILDADPQFRQFMLDGQTVCIDDILELRPSLHPRLLAHIQSGRITIGPWYVLQDELLVGAESIVRNLQEGLRSAGRFGQAMRIGYLPDAFGHIAQMPRILRGFGIETAVVWRGVGDAAPGSEWRWRAPAGAEVLCLFLPEGYGNGHRPGTDPHEALGRLRSQMAHQLPLSRASVMLWMNGNDHQPAEPHLPGLLAALARALPDIDIEHASLERAAQLVRERVDVAALPVVAGELRRSSPTVPVLSGVWSSRTWQKVAHDRAQALLVRFAEPFLAFAGSDRREPLRHAWRMLLKCQPHDSICGCSIDEVHRDIDDRLRHVMQLGHSLVRDATQALVGASAGDWTLHHAIAILNPHPFPVAAAVEVELQRPFGQPFRVVGPTGEVPYEILSRSSADGPELRAAEWIRLRVHVRDLPSHGVRILAIEAGEPATLPAPDAAVSVQEVSGGLALVDRESGLRVLHTFEDEGDRGDLYDFCPREDAPPLSSRDVDPGVLVRARVLGRRVELEAEIDNRVPDHRLRARFDCPTPLSSMWTETSFGWVERTTPGTHPVGGVTATPGFAVGGLGLHEVERAVDGGLLLTLFRAVGWMSRGDLSTRPGHAGYSVRTPDAQGLRRLRFRYALAFGAQAVRELEPGLVEPYAIALDRGEPGDRALLAIEPPAARLSIFKRADEGDGFIVRLCGSPSETVDARVRFFRPIARAWWSDLDERIGAPLAVAGGRDELTVPIPPNEVVTLRFVDR